MRDEVLAQATRADLADHLRDHYERLSRDCCDWSSAMPEAIDAWEREPKLRTECEALQTRLLDAEAAIGCAYKFPRRYGVHLRRYMERYGFANADALLDHVDVQRFRRHVGAVDRFFGIGTRGQKTKGEQNVTGS